MDLFCEDGSFCTADRTTEGREALTRFYSRIAEQPPIPFIQNHVLDRLEGDDAEGRCSAEIRMVQNGEAVTTAGWYEDVYRRIDGRWKFASRLFHVFHMVPLSKGWA